MVTSWDWRISLSRGDWNLRFERNTYQLTGFLALSHTTNSDDERITGSAGKIEFSRIGAKHWLWSVAGDFTTKNYNINDVSFFRRPNDFGAISTLTYKEDTPAKIVRNYRITAFVHQRQNFDGTNLARQMLLGADVLFTNYWQMDRRVSADFGLYDDRETRGKGLYRKPASFGGNISVETDDREWLVFDLSQEVVWDTKWKRSFELNAAMVLKPLAWMDWETEAGYERVRNQEAWVTNEIGSPVFADRSTDQYGFTLRSTLTFTRDLTLQLYGQLFLAKGHHENYRLLVGTSDFVRLNGSFDHDFNEQSLHTNVVLRWEYLPGSTLYLVWSQARSGENGDYFRTFGTDFGETFRVPPSNVLLLKAS